MRTNTMINFEVNMSRNSENFCRQSVIDICLINWDLFKRHLIKIKKLLTNDDILSAPECVQNGLLLYCEN